MERLEKVALSRPWVIIAFTLLQFVSEVGCVDFKSFRGDDRRCLYKDREMCEKDGKSQCEWCELPQVCYHRDVANRLGANCNRAQMPQRTETQECGDISSNKKCHSAKFCRWCQSTVLNDGCFRDWEARRMPKEVFDCDMVSKGARILPMK